MSFLVALTSNAAFAQETAGESPRRVRQLKLDMDEFIITGNVEKPQVQYFIGREKIRDSTPLDLKESFVSKIVTSVDREPF